MRNSRAILMLFTLLAGAVGVWGADAPAFKAEFDRICQNTLTAQELPLEELEKLVKDCDKLMKEIEASDHPSRKVYITRLTQCRDFLQFMVDTLEAESDDEAATEEAEGADTEEPGDAVPEEPSDEEPDDSDEETPSDGAS